MKIFTMILTILLILLTESMTFGQITTTKVVDKSNDAVVMPYDSLTNFLGENVINYLGQELYLKPLSESLRKFGYRGFIIENLYDIMDTSNIYKCCDSHNSKYDSLAGKYFKVIEIIKTPEDKQHLSTLYGDYHLKLEEKGSKDIVYFKYDTKYDFNFPFIDVGFYEKMKKKYVGQEFVLNKNIIEGQTDIKTGNKIINIIGEKWKCIDFTIPEKYYDLSLICQNSKNEQIGVEYNIIGSQYTAKDADNYKKKFGVKYWNLILGGEVKIGMTKEMCKLSWGEPKDINETIMKGKKSEQWVYEKNYLYFDNGILTAIQ